jgi:hypothetical protein
MLVGVTQNHLFRLVFEQGEYTDSVTRLVFAQRFVWIESTQMPKILKSQLSHHSITHRHEMVDP